MDTQCLPKETNYRETGKWHLRCVTEYGQMETGRILTKDMIISDVCIALHNTKLDHAHIKFNAIVNQGMSCVCIG